MSSAISASYSDVSYFNLSSRYLQDSVCQQGALKHWFKLIAAQRIFFQNWKKLSEIKAIFKIPGEKKTPSLGNFSRKIAQKVKILYFYKKLAP